MRVNRSSLWGSIRFDHICPQRLRSLTFPPVDCAHVAVESKVNPLNIKHLFHVSFILNGSVCTTPGIWSLPLLTAQRELPYNPKSPASHPTLLLDTKPPPPPNLRAQEGTHRGVWCGRKEERQGATQRDRKGQGLQVPSCSLSGTNEIHVRCSVIKKQMTQCRAVFRRFALQLQMAHSRRSHQPPLHSHIPPSERHIHTHTDKDAHTQPSLVSPSGSEKRPRLKCFPVEVTT